jgi:hypothetical protein
MLMNFKLLNFRTFRHVYKYVYESTCIIYWIMTGKGMKKYILEEIRKLPDYDIQAEVPVRIYFQIK